MIARTSALLVVSALSCAAGLGCIGTSPEEAAENAQGPEIPLPFGEDDEGPEHRPGQPCLVCHSDEHNPGEEEFVLAGTVYLRETDPYGVEGAEVIVVDDSGRSFTALTNATGNFYVRSGGDGEGGDRGEVNIPFDLDFPLSVRIRYGGVEQVMRSRIGREGSCAGCHGPAKGAESPGRVVVEETVP